MAQSEGFSRGGFSSGRGGFNQPTSNDNQSNSGFASRGSFASSRGSFGQSTDNNQESSGIDSTRGGGRGGFNNGRGQSNDNKENSGFSSRGGFGSRGSFGQSNEENSAFGSTRGRGGFNQNGGGGRTCYKCQGEGHMARECPNADSAGGGFNQNGGTGGRTCYKCQESGHMARECPNAESARGNAEASTEGGDTQQNNRANGETVPERAPVNFVPQARKVDELFSEDQQAEKEYADIVDNDEEVVIENFSGSTVRIQKWEEAEFEPQLLTNVKERSKYIRPRKIQGATIPFILDGFDIKSQAETGSGKTAAFVLPIIDACMKAKTAEGESRYDSELASPFAIIIAPSRELVMQVFEQAEKFAADTGISVAKAYGQYNICRNHAEIRCGCDILVAAPGRLKQFVTNGEIRCNKLKFLVLDEADRLLDQNFAVDILDIVNTSGFPAMDNRQTLLFSATFPPEMAILADQLLKKEAVFVTNRRNNPNKRIKQDFIVSDRPGKLDKLCDLLNAEAGKVGGADKIRRTLVFINTKPMCDMAAIYLCQRGIRATSIHGDRGQHLREQALSEFRSHKVSVLCATDVCARGIDVKQLDHVINMNLPTDATTYIHRIGRTGRIAKGWSTTFVQGGEPLLNEIAEMMRGNNEEVPETLKSAIGGIGDGASSSGFSAQPTSANNAAAPSTLPAKTAASTTATAKTVAVTDSEDDW
jgi:superfamily II DNA/RNA helicase